MQVQVVVLPIAEIKVGNRQRSTDAATEKHINELASEIGANGLLHAIAVNRSHELVAGYCRLNAIKRLASEYYYNSGRIDPRFIPCVVVHQESERDQFRLELMENLRRKNLSPLDEAKAIAALHRMFAEERGKDWTQEDTGKELDQLRGEERHPRIGHAEVGDALLLESFANDADVEAATSRAEAVKIAKRKLANAFTQGLGALANIQQSDMRLIEGDLQVELLKLPTASVDGIIVDPPYGIDADKFGDQAFIEDHQYEDSFAYATKLIGGIFEQGNRVCRENAHLYMFCDVRRFEGLSKIALESGWRSFPTPLMWYKVNVGHAPWPGYFSRRYECILFAMKGDRKLSKSRSDVFEYSVLTGEKLHAAQKPWELYKDFMELSFFPGDTVLDPCAGSGTIFRAAKAAKMKAIGIELEQGSINLCKAAIAQL